MDDAFQLTSYYYVKRDIIHSLLFTACRRKEEEDKKKQIGALWTVFAPVVTISVEHFDWIHDWLVLGSFAALSSALVLVN